MICLNTTCHYLSNRQFCQNVKCFLIYVLTNMDINTDMCIYVQKEFLEFYRSRNTSVFVTFWALQKHNDDKIDH